MMFCKIHWHWYQKAKCDKCVNKEKPYIRTRDEVADPNEWARFKRLGWTK